MRVEGGCHCGNISYVAEVDPESVYLCHCTDCQTLSGTAFRSIVPAPEATFQLLRGNPKIYIKTAESGAKREQVFCENCGTQIYATSVGGEARSINLRVGTIRQRNELRPRAQYWYRSAQPWVLELGEMEKTAMGRQ